MEEKRKYLLSEGFGFVRKMYSDVNQIKKF